MAFESPLSILYNSTGVELPVSSSQSLTNASQPGLLMMGSGSNGTAQFFKLMSDGSLLVSGAFSATPAGTQTVSMSNQPYVNQGLSGTISQSWYVRVTDGIQVLGTGSSAPMWITGAVTTNVTPVATQSVYVGGWNGLAVTAFVSELAAAVSTVSATLASSGLVGFMLASANSNRRGATFFLDGNRTAYLKMGTGADVNNFSIKMTNNAYWEVPFKYTGDITCTFSSGSIEATMYTSILT
ncbi:MAG: hypothetical protein WC761_01780 [Candidatus Paceibacterota bacterium]|jgi:hypothetical protein